MGTWGYSILAQFGRLNRKDIDALENEPMFSLRANEKNRREILLSQHLATRNQERAARQVDPLLEMRSPMIARRARDLDLSAAQHRQALTNLLKVLQYENPLDDSIPRANAHWLPLKPKLISLLARADLTAQRKNPGWYQAKVRGEIFRKMLQDLESQPAKTDK